MKFEIKKWWTIDVPSLNKIEAMDPSEVFFPLFFDVGQVGHAPSTQFQVMIVTPESLLHRRSELKPVYQVRCIVLFELSARLVLKHIEGIVKSVNAVTSQDGYDQLSRSFIWEYENYSIYPDCNN
jgi:Immunity protein 8